METLRSPLYEVADAFEANELFQRNGWTDGLPIVPPTDTIVGRFLEAAGLSPTPPSASSRYGAGGSPPRRSPSRR